VDKVIHMIDGKVSRVLSDPKQIEILARTSNFEMAESQMESDKLEAFFKAPVRQVDGVYTLANLGE